MSTLREALDEAQAFLAPVWSAGSDDIIDLLSGNSEISSSSDRRREVQRKLLALLLRINEADISSQDQGKPATSEGEYDEDSRKTLYGLLDLLAVRGILASLSPGVAIAHRPKSVIQGLNNDSNPRQSSQQDIGLLCELIDGVAVILKNPRLGLAPLIRKRIIVDVVAGAGELAFSPGLNEAIHAKYQRVFKELIDEIPTSSVLPLLTYLIQPTTPQWLKSHISGQLSLIPLRSRGVRHTIEFIASSYPPPPQAANDPRRSSDSRTLPLPLDALLQASKLLSAVPSGLSAEDYFNTLAPQLWTMLDGNDGPEFRKAAALVISTVLGQRNLGAPGAVGWKLFAEPMISNISPPVSGRPSEASSSSLEPTIVPERDLKRALTRLTTLLTARPNIGLNKRLVGRLMLPLWALLDYSKSRPLDRSWRDTAWGLLEIYIRLGATSEQLDLLATNLLFDGPPGCKFAPGSEGGVEIRRREKPLDEENIIEQMAKVEQRLSTYQVLLSSGAVEDQDIGDLFVRLTKKWLLPQATSTRKATTLRGPGEEDPLQSLINAKLVMGMLEKFKDKLAASPRNMIVIVKQLLDEWIESDNTKKKREQDLQKATYTSLSNIVHHSPTSVLGVAGEPDLNSEVDSSELLPVALSLLSIIITAPNFKPTPQTSETLSSIIPSLHPIAVSRSLSESVSHSATSLLSQISAIFDIPLPASAADPTTQPEADSKALKAALTELIDPAPPIRASGLSTIRDLTIKGSSAIDVPTMTLLLIRDMLTDREEYVYLHAIRTLVALCNRDPPLVSKLLIDAFTDPKEEAVGEGGLEGRLRVGEALGQIISELTEKPDLGAKDTGIWAPVIQRIASGTLTVASRRGQRKKDLASRKRNAALARKKQEEAERAWGGTVPAMPSLRSLTSLNLSDATDEPESEHDKADRELLERIIAGWSDTGLEEDVRLRTSGLSVLGSVLESPATLSLLPPATLRSAVDVALGALSLETDASHAILRRAAALLLMGLLRGMDGALEAGGATAGAVEGVVAPVMGAGRWAEVQRVVGWVRDGDEDAVVRGHAGVVLEAVETVGVKRALGVRADGTVVEGGRGGVRLGLEGELRGLDVNVEREESGGDGGVRPKIEELE